MLYFPKEFFEDEVRDGFYVSSIMKKCWAAQLEILHDIDTVCRRNNIRWYADCGTLLGAVRHGGFIPWDDDMDICMLRDDYLKFLKVSVKELHNIWHGYSILNYHNEQYWEPISRVVNSKSMSFDDARMEKFHGYPFSVGVDIFPLDYVCRDIEEEESRKEMLRLIYGVAESDFTEELNGAQLEELGEALGMPFDHNRSIKLQLYELGEMISSLYTKEEADEVVLMKYWVSNSSHKYSLDLFEKTVDLPFENIQIKAPVGYDQVLRVEYGDYMRIVKTAGSHGYPYYDIQIRELEKIMGDASPCSKKVTKADLKCCQRYESEISASITAKDKDGYSKRGKREVVFLPFTSRYWFSLEYMWNLEKSTQDTEVFVVPVPYYEKNSLGDIKEYINKNEKYPEYVTLTNYEDYDFEKRHPDKIIIQYTYDDDNFYTTIDARFYAKNLKKYTDELVYIPYFETDEIGPGEERAYKMMDNYVISPAVVYADKVMVQSDDMKKLYVQKLTEFFGKDSERLWKDKRNRISDI